VPYDHAYGPGFEDMFRRVPCLEKIERLLGYRPSTPLPVILDSVVADIQERLSEEPAGMLATA
jgi:UDP-glucose 4-epimerase